MKTVTAYEAFDGAQFRTEEECAKYERGQVHFRLAGLAADDILKAMAREPSHAHISQALEHAGIKIRRARQEAGDVKYHRRKKAAENA